MARDTTLSAAAAHRRRSADAGDPDPGCEVWAVRLPTHHGVVTGCGMGRGEGSSTADLATRRAESAAETASARAAVAGRWFVCGAAPSVALATLGLTVATEDASFMSPYGVVVVTD